MIDSEAMLERARQETNPRPSLTVTVVYDSGSNIGFNQTFSENADKETAENVLKEVCGMMFGVRNGFTGQRSKG